jgi:hypothetical protein
MKKKIKIECAVCGGSGYIPGWGHDARYMNKKGEQLQRCPDHTPTRIVFVTEE